MAGIAKFKYERKNKEDSGCSTVLKWHHSANTLFDFFFLFGRNICMIFFKKQRKIIHFHEEKISDT